MKGLKHRPEDSHLYPGGGREPWEVQEQGWFSLTTSTRKGQGSPQWKFAAGFVDVLFLLPALGSEWPGALDTSCQE